MEEAHVGRRASSSVDHREVGTNDQTQGPKGVYTNCSLKEGSLIYYLFSGLIGVRFKIAYRLWSIWCRGVFVYYFQNPKFLPHYSNLRQVQNVSLLEFNKERCGLLRSHRSNLNSQESKRWTNTIRITEDLHRRDGVMVKAPKRKA